MNSAEMDEMEEKSERMRRARGKLMDMHMYPGAAVVIDVGHPDCVRALQQFAAEVTRLMTLAGDAWRILEGFSEDRTGETTSPSISPSTTSPSTVTLGPGYQPVALRRPGETTSP